MRDAPPEPNAASTAPVRADLAKVREYHAPDPDERINPLTGEVLDATF
ncbi:hypothetical protein [Tessaracoccus sp. Z1128]